jgi:GxxExxY protein
MQVNEITDAVIGAAIEVHKVLGPGLLESAYVQCLCYELTLRKLPFALEVPLPVIYKGLKLDCGYRMDMVVADRVVVEVKAVEHLAAINEAQLLTYLRLSGRQVALLINFNVPVLRQGIMRRVLGLKE